MARAFMSFLGTSEYVDCRYKLDEETGSLVKYVQEDIVGRFCRDWTGEDQIRIYTTVEAETANWNDDGHRAHGTGEIIPGTGLGSRLKETACTAADIRRIPVPKGNSEEEIWSIFEILFDSIRQGETVIFDITHSLRSLPMLCMVLIGYAKVLKEITVGGIYYGAFEILGNVRDVRQMDPDERVAPMFDLTAFAQLMDWTQATRNFIRNGIAEDFCRLVEGQINPVLARTKGKDKPAQELKALAKGIHKISQNLLVNRGAEIVQFEYARLGGILDSLRSRDLFIKPMGPLLEVISRKIAPFADNDTLNGFRAVEWCLEHGLHQQAITMLQETFLTHVLSKNGRDWGVRSHRLAAATALARAANPLIRDAGDGGPSRTSEQKALEDTLMKDPLVQEFAPFFDALSKIRNDVNHGGYLTEESNKSRPSETIISKILLDHEFVKEKFLPG
jgi:CRISPR-associated DxTHG motif protein